MNPEQTAAIAKVPVWGSESQSKALNPQDARDIEEWNSWLLGPSHGPTAAFLMYDDARIKTGPGDGGHRPGPWATSLEDAAVNDPNVFVPRCYYCGEPAESIDHVVPRAVLRTLRVLDDQEATDAVLSRNRAMEVDCCGDCNSRLGSEYSQTLIERKALLKVRLRKKYVSLLGMPAWTDAELGRLSPELRGYVLNRWLLKERIMARLAYSGPATRLGVPLR